MHYHTLGLLYFLICRCRSSYYFLLENNVGLNSFKIRILFCQKEHVLGGKNINKGFIQINPSFQRFICINVPNEGFI